MRKKNKEHRGVPYKTKSFGVILVQFGIADREGSLVDVASLYSKKDPEVMLEQIDMGSTHLEDVTGEMVEQWLSMNYTK